MSKKRVYHFVDRIAILDEMQQMLCTSQSRRVVLLGTGGSGKTQLALEFCRQAEKIMGFTAVFWIDASSPTSVLQSYNDIARSLSKDGSDKGDSKALVALFQRTLRNWTSRWLVVFDNFDNPKAFESQDISNYIPAGETGSILFTSRHTDTARLGHGIDVSILNEGESLNLLMRRPSLNAEEKKDGQEIAFELGYLALALDQAAAYICARRLPLKDFLLHYNKRKQVILEEIPDQWEYRRKLPDSEEERTLSAFTTWEMSFDLISGSVENKQRKEHFLTLSAFFNTIKISEKYFRIYCRSVRLEWLDLFKTSDQWDSFKLNDVLAEFRKLSLLKLPDEQADELSFSIHPLVRDWIRLRNPNTSSRNTLLS